MGASGYGQGGWSRGGRGGHGRQDAEWGRSRGEIRLLPATRVKGFAVWMLRFGVAEASYLNFADTDSRAAHV